MGKRAGRIGLVLALASTYLLQISAPAANAATTYSFTSAGATGANGPTQAQVNTAYSGTSLASRVTISTQGIQRFTVPSAGRYQIELAGAKGGNSSVTGGSGARFTTNAITLTAGEVIRIGVGQIGIITNDGTGSGGGGASWVYRESNSTLLAIAGGGGGGGISGITNSNATAQNESTGVGRGGSDSGATTANGGTSGNGGVNAGSTCGFGGAGWLSGGTATASCGRAGGIAAVAINSTAVGGSSDTGSGVGSVGGFGGGGAGAGNCGYGGGGGGYSGGGGGTYSPGCGGPGGAGGSYSTTGFNWVGTNAAVGFVTITALGPSITTFAPTTTITNSTSLSYNIVFSETVTGLATADFSKSGTGSSTCTIGTPSGSGTTYTLGLTGCSPGTVILTMAAGAVTNADPQTAPDANTNAATVTIDQTAPTITSVSAPTSTTWIPGSNPSFTVIFSESVTVTGTPRLTLTVGTLTKYANLFSMSDSKTATFRYTVGTSVGEFDTDGIAVSTSLDLNAGTIKDVATNDIVNLSFSTPTLTSVLVAQKPGAPTIDSITATSGQLSINFTPGATNGSAISNYEYSTNNGTNWTTRSPVATTSPITITGLSNGTTYPVRIRAINAAGSSDSSTAINGTPTAVVVAGGSNISITFGQSASSSQFTSTGGTGVYVYTLSSTPSGVSISNAVVSVDSTTAAGTYTLNVIASDNAGTPQTGFKQIIIVIAKATTTITISLPNGVNDAALGGAITITATVSKPGTVAFKIGGTNISGCGAATAASTTATCSWTPGSLGGASLTALLTPTDSSNYESSTTTTLSITVVNGVSTITISLTGGVTETPKSRAINIIAVISQAGKVTFLADGKRIPGCYNVSASAGNKTCSWRPTAQKLVTITASLNPTNSVYDNSTSSMKVWVVRRTGPR